MPFRSRSFRFVSFRCRAWKILAEPFRLSQKRQKIWQESLETTPHCLKKDWFLFRVLLRRLGYNPIPKHI